mgnify:CR=1 FL=1
MAPTPGVPTAPPTKMPPAVVARPPRGWSQGPTPDTVAEHLRSLEITITRRLDGVLHGNHQGLTPGHGSEPGESRQYQPGDDVRRIDWNVTARTNETFVREQIADRDLLAWLVVDVSATMDFGTQPNDKSETAMAAAATIGFLTARAQNRLGAVLVAGPDVHVMPPRAGKNQVRAILSSLASPRVRARAKPAITATASTPAAPRSRAEGATASMAVVAVDGRRGERQGRRVGESGSRIGEVGRRDPSDTR